VTGLDCRIGVPNGPLATDEELPKKVLDELTSPLFATGIGLLVIGIATPEYHAASNENRSKLDVAGISQNGRSRSGFLAKLVKFISDDSNVNVYEKDYTK